MARLNLSFFGTFSAAIEEQPIVSFRASSCQGLLVYLVLQCERPFHREVLSTLLWPDATQHQARNNLGQALHQLRKLLCDLQQPTEPYLLVTRQTVQFNADSDYALDVHHFLEAIDDSNWESAASLYYGDLLTGFANGSLAFETWLRQERERLHRLALAALDEMAEEAIRNGRFQRAQTAAQRQLALEPWRERAHRHLMRGLALAGDRSAALAQYHACRDALQEALGVAPAQETIALFESIKAEKLFAQQPKTPQKPPLKRRHNLPAPATPLVGREREVSHLTRLLVQTDERLVTIVGPGGAGKTRLALTVGSTLLGQFRDGVYLVDLAPLGEADAIPLAVATELAYQPPANSGALFPELLKALRRQQLLLILDNFEHLLDGTTFVNDLLMSCPGVTLLVTSRQRLGLVGENAFALGGLDLPNETADRKVHDYTAIQLFVAHGRRVQRSFALTEENERDVVRICQLVEGLPLGLLLAASWLSLLRPVEIAAEIENSFSFLAASLDDLPLRQRSMHAVFEHSWRMMTPSEQNVMAALSVFRGGFSREAAQRVASARPRDLLALLNKSMLQREEESGRFKIHELLRQFAEQKLERSGRYEEALLAHSRYFAQSLAEQTELALDEYSRKLATSCLPDWDNIQRAWQTAVAHGQVDGLAKMARALISLCHAKGVRPNSMFAGVNSKLTSQGVPEDLPARYELQYYEMSAQIHQGLIEKPHLALFQFLAKLALQAHSELLYWGYSGLRFWSGTFKSQALHWNDQAYLAALRLENEMRLWRVQAFALKYFVRYGSEYGHSLVQLSDLSGDSLLAKCEYLLSQLEPKADPSWVLFELYDALSLLHLDEEAYDTAVSYINRALEMGKRWEDLYMISIATDRLIKIFLKAGRPDRCRAALLDVLAWELAIGKVWEVLGFLQHAAAVYPLLVGGDAAAVSIISMVDHHPECLPSYKIEYKEALQSFKMTMGDDAFQAAWRAGRALDYDTAVDQLHEVLTR